MLGRKINQAGKLMVVEWGEAPGMEWKRGRGQGQVRRWARNAYSGPWWGWQLAGELGREAWVWGHGEVHVEDIVFGISFFSTVQSGETPGVRRVKWPLGEKCPRPSFPFTQVVSNSSLKTKIGKKTSVPFTAPRMNAFFGGSRKLMPF